MMFGVQAYAQNVTISPSSGSLIAGLTYTGEVGFQNGWSSLWRHEQLPLTLTVSDKPDLTEGGVLQDPAGNISLDTSQNLFVLMSGAPVTTKFHMNISLPKGYRFTGYRIVLLNNVNGKTVNNMTYTTQDKTLYETASDFNIGKALATTGNMPRTNETREYVIERTSMTEDDMGNNLYFILDHYTSGYYGVTMKSCELYFTAEGDFNCMVEPGSPTELVAEGVNMIAAPFLTNKLDLGPISPNTKAGVTYFSYDYRNVKELTANNYLYEASAVTADNKLPATAGTGNIQALKNGDNFYYALGNSTYWIETPTSTTSQDDVEIPLGYRITGAKLKYHFGEAAGESTINANGLNVFHITYNNRYLQANGSWGTTKTNWTLTSQGYLKSGNYYLYNYKQGNTYTVYSTTRSSRASVYTLEGNYFTTQTNNGKGYLSYTSNGNVQITAASTNAATKENSSTGTYTNPAFTPGAYTLVVYDKDGSTVHTTMQVDAGTPDGEVFVKGMNNDAFKFEIQGLPEGAKALVTFELMMQALNPFINSMDIVCTSTQNPTNRLVQQFTSNDFQVAGGSFLFYIPSEFFEGVPLEDQKCTFTFENLYSKYGDESYDNGTNLKSRYFFVKSPYYKDFGDGKQYVATGDEEASTKIHTSMCGDKPFNYSNAAALDPNSGSTEPAALEEYPYSEALYVEQGGTFTENIELGVNDDAKDCYLFTGDETRWNIAPTTALEHRYFAYYLMNVDLDIKDYDAKCELTKLYDSTFHETADGDSEAPMYGGKFLAYEKGTTTLVPSNQAFLPVNMMVQALRDALAEVDATAKQLLYLDYTHLYSVAVGTDAEVQEIVDKLNPNCLVYFPERSYYNGDNFTQKTKSGNFRACKDIVITDKQPFYAPYAISIPAENHVRYTRQITVPKNGKVASATVVLPFNIKLNAEGLHTNDTDDGTSFYINTMAPGNCLSLENNAAGSPEDYKAKAHFERYTETLTLPNTPYMVEVVKAPADENISFTITQKGSIIAATKDSEMNTTDYTFEGETAVGTMEGASYTFKNYGSYAGKKLDKNGSIFYFAGNMYLNSHNLRPEYTHVKVYPFRAYYLYQTSGGGAKVMNSFFVEYGANTGATGITDVSSNPDLAVSASNGNITIAAAKDQNVRINSVSGAAIVNMEMMAGQTRTVAVPKGMYIVNGVKIIVK